MSVHVTFKCDDLLPSGMTCRGGLSTPVTVDSDGIIDMDAAWNVALRAGWSDDVNEGEEGMAILEFCPSCTLRRKKLVGTSDP